MMGPIMKKKKNKCIPHLLDTTGSRYKDIKRIAKSLGIDHNLPLTAQDPSIPKSTRKRKAIEVEPEQFTIGLH